ncbi:hypothetical protein NBRC116583_11220 [Arenicella sp. 4NH20-0111]
MWTGAYWPQLESLLLYRDVWLFGLLEITLRVVLHWEGYSDEMDGVDANDGHIFWVYRITFGSDDDLGNYISVD